MSVVNLPTKTDLADFYPLESLAKQGDVLSRISAEILEDILETNQDDIANRARLLGYYARCCVKRNTSSQNQKTKLRTNHILWFIENAPDSRFASDKFFSIECQTDKLHCSQIGTAI